MRRYSTFHSVYISTATILNGISPLSFSTFHSVYISTGDSYATSHYLKSLHSTLFILVLYQVRKIMKASLDSTFHSVYISTICSGVRSFFFDLSTFHSVYISTYANISNKLSEVPLHSTLFILVLFRRFNNQFF